MKRMHTILQHLSLHDVSRASCVSFYVSLFFWVYDILWYGCAMVYLTISLLVDIDYFQFLFIILHYIHVYNERLCK